MIATELSRGQGLGNQLFCYVTARAAAKRKKVPFTIFGKDTLANNIHSSCGLYFMDLDFGVENVPREQFHVYEEQDVRYYVGNSRHDYVNGCYVAGRDMNVLNADDWTLLKGNLQDESYYLGEMDDVREWLRVKQEYCFTEFSDENICVLHVRCGDYLGNRELLLRKKYWLDGIERMLEQNPNMRFVAVSNGIEEAKRMLPSFVETVSFELAADYSILNNAYYLLLGNSSFAYFPAVTNEKVKYILAPKYWARHNVSNGYWASEQNIYSHFHYMDRKGEVFTASECRNELKEYKDRVHFEKKIERGRTKKEMARLCFRELCAHIRKSGNSSDKVLL